MFVNQQYPPKVFKMADIQIRQKLKVGKFSNERQHFNQTKLIFFYIFIRIWLERISGF